MRTKTGLPLFSAIKKIPLSQSFPCIGDSGNEFDLPQKYLFSERISALHFIVSIVNRPFYGFRWKRSLS